MRMRAIPALLVLLVLLVASTSATATVNDGWSSPLELSDWHWPASDGGHSLNLGPEGTQLAAWLVGDGGSKWALWARVRPPGHYWETAADVSRWRDLVFKGVPTDWSSGVAPDGTAWLLWVDIDSSRVGDNVLVMTAHRPPGPGQGWHLFDLTEGAYETSIRSAELHIGPDGDVAATWVACASSSIPSDGPCHVRVRRRAAGANTWESTYQADETFSGEGIETAHVVVGPGGMTVVLWTQYGTSSPAKLALMSRAYSPTPAPGAWEATAVNISGWQSYVLPAQPVIDPGGTVTAAWRSSAPDPTKHAYYANTRPAAGSWNVAPAQLSAGRSSYGGLGSSLAVGQNGTVSVAYVHFAGGTETYLYANTRQAGSPWSGEQLVYGGPNLLVRNQKLGVWPDGSVLVLFWLVDSSRDGSQDTCTAWSMRPPNGNWGDGGQAELGDWVETISDMGLKLDLDGGAIAAWAVSDTSRPAGEQYQVRAAMWPPGAQFEPPIALSDWNLYAWVHDSSLVLGQFGEPAAVAWEGTRPPDPGKAIFYSELGNEKRVVYLPVVLRNWP